MIKIFAAALILVAAPAAAQKGAWQVGDRQIHLYYADLDMNSAAGRAAMLGRVEAAAARLCRHLIASERRACVADTLHVTAKSAGGRPLRLAMTERDAVRLAAR